MRPSLRVLLYALSALFVLPPLAQAATRYSSASGSGSSCSQASPCTLSAGVSQTSAGDTLLLRGGTYASWVDTNNTVFPSGTSWVNPVTIAAAPNETVTFTNQIFFGSASNGVGYIILDRLNINCNFACEALFIGYGAHHIRYQNGEIQNGDQGVHVVFPGLGNEILQSRIHHHGFQAGAFGNPNQRHGIYWTASDGLIEGNEIYDNTGCGIHAYSGGYGPDKINNTVIRSNRLHDNTVQGAGGCSSILIADGSGNLVYNNLIYNNTSGGIWIYSNAVNTGLYNNTIYNNSNQPAIHLFANTSGSVIKNNIMYLNSAGTVQIDSGAAGTDYPTSVNLTSDPAFANAGSADFHLTSGSAAIDHGASLAVIFTSDFAGTTRPTGVSWDIGAFEFVNQGGIVPPPRNIRVITLP